MFESTLPDYGGQVTSQKVEDAINTANATIGRMKTSDPRTIASSVRDAQRIYESASNQLQRQATSKRLSETVPVNEAMITSTKDTKGDDVFPNQDVLLYTPYSASTQSGIPFMPSNSIDAPDVTELSIIDHSNVEKLLDSQFSRMVLPTNGRIHYTGAVQNNVIVESATRPVITKFRGHENVQPEQELKYHPLGWFSHMTGDVDGDVWAYRKRDLYRGIPQDSMITSNLEYTSQDKQLAAMRVDDGDDEVNKLLAEIYKDSVDLTAFGENAAMQGMADTLDSQNSFPTGEPLPEYTDSTDDRISSKLVAEARNSIGVAGYAPVPDAWWINAGIQKPENDPGSI